MHLHVPLLCFTVPECRSSTTKMKAVTRLIALLVALLAYSLSLAPSASPHLTSLFGDGRVPRVLLLTAHPDDEVRFCCYAL